MCVPRTFWVVLLAMLWGAVPPAFAETRYVSDVLVINLRDAPSSGGTNLAHLKTGESFEVLGAQGNYLRVRTPAGEEGWVRQQYTTAEIPKAHVVATLRQELAQVKKISVQRSRIDIFLNLDERRLTGHQDGPFTLYNRLDCRVELEIEAPRQMVKQKNLDGLDRLLLVAMDRHTAYQEARNSEMWNERVCQDLPADYPETLFQHSVWQAEQVNAGIESVLTRSFDALVETSAAVQNDPDYLEGFGHGVDLARAGSPRNECPALMGAGLAVPTVKPPHDLADDAAAHRWRKGHHDGFLYIRAVNLQRYLPACFVPVPQRQDVADGSRSGGEMHSRDLTQEPAAAPSASGGASR